MKEKSQLISGKAFQIFRTELEKHLRTFEECRDSNSIDNREVYKKLSASFHTIRGGAGFFGLADISQCAEELETIFLNPHFSASNEMPQVLEIFNRLKRAASEVLEDKV